MDDDTLPPFPAPFRDKDGLPSRPGGRGGAVLGFLELLGAAVLVGGLATTALVAQLAFRSPAILSEETAGLFAGRVFEVFIYAEIGAALLIVIGNVRRRSIGKQIAIWAIMLAIVAHVGIGRAMHALRMEAGGSIHRVAKDDPRRQRFGALHGIYVAASGVMLAGGIAVLAASARRRAAA